MTTLKSKKRLAGAGALVALIFGGTMLTPPASAATGAWTCGGIPPGMVSTETRTNCQQSALLNNYVTAPQDGMWICGWGAGALDGFVNDEYRSNFSACQTSSGWGTGWHIVKVG